MRGADLLVKTLSNAGVEVIFTLSGNQIMPVFDACLDAGIRLIHTRHEGAAVYMAEAYAQLTGKVGVALITAAPGFTSGLGPLYMARKGENPVLLLSGDSSVGQDGMGAFQELDQAGISAPLTKFSDRPKAPADLGKAAAKALSIAASGRPGPTHLALAFDVLNGDAAGVPVPSAADCAPAATRPGDKDIQAILDAVAQAERPMILTGPANNRTRSGGRVEKLADALDAPILSLESPRGLNDPSLGDFKTAMGRADVIVSLGKDIDFTTGFGQAPAFAEDVTFLMIDPEDDILARAQRAMGDRMILKCQADVRPAMDALIAAGPGGTDRAIWRDEVATAVAARPTVPATDSGPMHPADLFRNVQKFLDDATDPVLILDGGEAGQWAQACLTAPSRIINGPSGAIGGCLCYAVAAKVARPDATVIVVMGDGTAGFHFAEFETAHRYGADFTAIIAHDARWNAEYQIQLREYGPQRLYECELDDTRYDLAAAGFGCHGEQITDPDEVGPALQRAAASGKTACLVAKIRGVPAPAGAGH